MNEFIYGLLSSDKQCYEKIEVEKMVSPKSIQLKNPPAGTFIPAYTPNLFIARIVYGVVHDGGRYLLRVRDEGTDTRYLVRYEVGDEVRFQVVDFHDQEVLH